MVRTRIQGLAMLLLPLLLAGCAAQRAYQEGNALVARDQVGAGLAKYQEALASEPDNPVYRAAFLRARYDNFKELVSGALVSRDGNTPTGGPERTASIWTAWRFLPQWQAGFGARYVGERQGNTANTTKLPSYVVLDASLAYDYSRNLKLGLAVKNLADRDYALAGTANTRWLLGAPRTVQLTARATF